MQPVTAPDVESSTDPGSSQSTDAATAAEPTRFRPFKFLERSRSV
jgi:hypothetical protein